MASYNLRSGFRKSVSMMDLDKNREHGDTVQVDQQVITSDTFEEPSTSNMNTMFQLLMEQNRLLMQQLAVFNTTSNQGNQFYVMPDLNKSIKPFTGHESRSEAKDWLNTFNGIADINKWSLKIESVRANLNGPAQQWFKSRTFSSWKIFEKQFTKSFIGDQNTTELWQNLVSRVQLKGEPTVDYFYEKVRLCSELNLSFDQVKTQLLEGFYSRDMVTYLLSKHHKDTDEIFNDIQTYENLNKVRTKRIVLGNSLFKYSQSNSTVIQKKIEDKKKDQITINVKRCFNCYSTSHTIRNCNKPKRAPGSCFKCGSMEHRQKDCNDSLKTKEEETDEQSTMMIEISELCYPPYTLSINIECQMQHWTLDAVIDSGRNFICDKSIKLSFEESLLIEKVSNDDFIFDDIMLIDIDKTETIKLDINENLSVDVQDEVNIIFKNYYLNDVVNPKKLEAPFELEVKLTKDHVPFYFRPRRMSFSEKEKLKTIINELLAEKIIRPSNSPYCSPIVLIKKKTNDLRLCVDFRELNKITIKDRFPLPIIDDTLDMLKDKVYFTRLDLKNAFYHVKVKEESIKYLSFITPMGQFEYTRMPFGFCNSPSIFMR
ncbi:uncharacterized protein LOC126904043 [Daktulosphaira vitifoliae]|uniref:uncharacterized protein LOC126904043 n=1 Tax=Daktulosphaira vitifoliae TaxID=58002 RepID=UPI0021AA6217|nr:uncharacterized protein LOC126904043 [Daktulosphaira vitifoliae]